MAEIRILCAIIGESSLVLATIKLGDYVAELKDAIKAEAPNVVFLDADWLALFVAKRGDSWLKASSTGVRSLLQGEIPDEIRSIMREPMESSCSVEKYFGSDFAEGNFGDVLVIVELPERAHRLRALEQQDGSGGSPPGVSSWLWSLPSQLLLLLGSDESPRANKDD